MRPYLPFLLVLVLASTALADIAPRPPGAKKPPQAPPPQSTGPGGGQSATERDGPTMGPAPEAKAARPDEAAVSEPALLASADLPPPTDADPKRDETVKIAGAIALVVGVYVAVRLVRRGGKSE
jgi:hypothetical protein